MQAIEVEFAITTDKKLRGQLRDAGSMESQITALQIASLRKVNKGTKVLLLDKNASVAKSVAKDLARKGYGSVYVIEGESRRPFELHSMYHSINNAACVALDHR